jgi:hypothetical protein
MAIGFNRCGAARAPKPFKKDHPPLETVGKLNNTLIPGEAQFPLAPPKQQDIHIRDRNAWKSFLSNISEGR